MVIIHGDLGAKREFYKKFPTIARVEYPETIESSLARKSEEYLGWVGEYRTLSELKQLNDTFHVFCDKRIELENWISHNGKNRKSAQIDLVVVGRTGIYAIEVKSWTKESHMKHKQKYDPHEQTDASGLFLYIHLKHVNHDPQVRKLLVSTTAYDFGKNDEYPHVYSRQLQGLVSHIKRGTGDLSDAARREIVSALGGQITDHESIVVEEAVHERGGDAKQRREAENQVPRESSSRDDRHTDLFANAELLREKIREGIDREEKRRNKLREASIAVPSKKQSFFAWNARRQRSRRHTNKKTSGRRTTSFRAVEPVQKSNDHTKILIFGLLVLFLFVGWQLVNFGWDLGQKTANIPPPPAEPVVKIPTTTPPAPAPVVVKSDGYTITTTNNGEKYITVIVEYGRYSNWYGIREEATVIRTVAPHTTDAYTDPGFANTYGCNTNGCSVGILNWTIVP